MTKTFSSALLVLLVVCCGSAAWAGMVSFTFDDGLSSVYYKALPILKAHGQVATLGIITAKLKSSDEDFMTADQVKELQTAGWEIASHSLTNSRPVSIPWYYSQEPVTGWEKSKCGPNVFQAEYVYDQIAGVYEEEQALTEVATQAEVSKQPGTYYYDRPIAELYVNPLTMTTPDKLNIRAGSYEREMDQSKRELAQLGFKVSTFVAQGTYWTNEIKEISAYYYPYAVAGNGADNRREGFDAHAVKRFLVHQNDSAASLIRLIQENAVSHDGWVVLRMYGVGSSVGPDPVSEDTLKQLCDWLAKQNVKVVTVSQGAAIMSGDKSGQAAKKKT